eukprot:g606.t1
MSQYSNLGRLSAPPVSLYERATQGGKNSDTGTQSTLDGVSNPPELTRTSVATFLEKRSTPNLGRTSVVRAEQELLNRTYYPTSCNVTLGIRDNESRDSVHYKFDGTRFQNADATIKMITGVSYEISLTIKPNMDLTDNLLHLQCSIPDSVPRQFLVSMTHTRVDERGFSGSWKCELEPNKKSQRVSFNVSGRIRHFGEFHLPLLLKVYPDNSKAAGQGFRLKMMTFQLKQDSEDETSLTKLNALRYISQ